MEVPSKAPQMDICKGRFARALAMCFPLECFGGDFKKSQLEIPETTPFGEDVVNLVAEIRKIPVGAKLTELFLFELLLNANSTLYHAWGISLMDKNKYKDADSLEIHIIPDHKNQTLSIVDNGVGMTRDDLMTSLSYDYPTRYMNTIKKYLNTIKKYLTYEAGADLSPIYKMERSEWALGFFSAYMVADKVVVTTRMQGGDPFVWECKVIDNAVSTFSVSAAAPVDDSFVHGTKVTLHLAPGHGQYLSVDKLQELVNKYKRLINFYPISVFPNGKKEPGILLNEKKEEEPIEKLKEQYEDIRLLFVEYISERAKNVDVVISDRPRMGVFCNLDVFEEIGRRPVLEINPRCPEMKVLRKMLDFIGKFKEARGEMVEFVRKQNEEECVDIALVSGDTNDPEAVKTKKRKAVSYTREMKKAAAVKRKILEHFEWSLSRIRLYDCLRGTSFYEKAVDATALDHTWSWKPPVFMD